MTTQRFDATPTPNEAMSLDEISTENVKEAWKDYEAKPEYKKFNKHDLIESMQISSEETEQSEKI
ncbi:NF038105 family protein [Acinetobacter sp. TTH0-4]|uniref:NF038105 family protein n=1 Tax=Acinetobacter sp. TTH0-4 TaxID=1646498 RepID=UPI00189CB5D7|nr:NF038105 family protein [Acinetobacter sp. TTH0-4]QPF38743.1 NF038105 family protein [Acinetobacter sp. TTH0-4]